MQIRYRVDAIAREGHRGRFTVELTGVTEPTVDLVVPSWVPGSYHLVNYVRGFRNVTARASHDGALLATQRVESTRWRIATEGQADLRVDYTVYGHELVTEAFDLTPDHLFLNAALSLPYVDHHQEDPVEVELHLPPDWRVVTELEEVTLPTADLPRPQLRRARRFSDRCRPPPRPDHPAPWDPPPHRALRGGRELRSPSAGAGLREDRRRDDPPHGRFPARRLHVLRPFDRRAGRGARARDVELRGRPTDDL